MTCSSDPHFQGIYYKLLYGRQPGDTRACTTSMSSTDRDLVGVALAEYYNITLRPFEGFATQCSGDQATEPYDFYFGLGDFADDKQFYEDAYADCLFRNVELVLPPW